MKNISIILAGLLLVSLLSACATEPAGEQSEAQTQTEQLQPIPDEDQPEQVDTAAEEAAREDAQPYEVDAATQAVPFAGILNARQLGGYPTMDGRRVKEGVLLRTAKLDEATGEDIDKLCSEYNLRAIIDLRDEEETAQLPDPSIDGVAYRNLDAIPRPVADATTVASMVEVDEENLVEYEMSQLQILQQVDYMQMADLTYSGLALEDAAIQSYREMFEVLLNTEDGAVLFHCMAGKDRTGIAGVLVLSALGVENDIITHDFLLSNIFLGDLIEEFMAAAESECEDEEMLKHLRMSLGVDAYYLECYYAAIEREYGGMEEYLETAMNLDAEKLARLRELYTEAA